MRENEVVTADHSAVSIFNEQNHKILTDRLTHQQGLTGILGKLISNALDQGTEYRDNLEMHLIYVQLHQGIEDLVSIVTGFKPSDSPTAKAGNFLSLNSDSNKNAPHPLIQG